MQYFHKKQRIFPQYSQYSQLDLTTTHELDAIFSNITDIAELTVTLIGSLEDTLEMAEDGQVGRTLSYKSFCICFDLNLVRRHAH